MEILNRYCKYIFIVTSVALLILGIWGFYKVVNLEKQADIEMEKW